MAIPNAASAVPTIDETAATVQGVDQVPVQQGGTIEFSPSPAQGIVGGASGGENPGDNPGNLQPAVDGSGNPITHDADQVVNMWIGQWCQRFNETPRAAMFHIRSILDRMYVQVLS